MITEPNDPIGIVEMSHQENGDVMPLQTGQYTSYSLGLTKREYYAGLAMQGMLVNGAQTEHGGKSLAPTTIAMYAVMQADALIAELNKRN